MRSLPCQAMAHMALNHAEIWTYVLLELMIFSVPLKTIQPAQGAKTAFKIDTITAI